MEGKREKKEWGGGGGVEERMNTIVFSDNETTQRAGAGCAEGACLCGLDMLILLFNVYKKLIPSIGRHGEGQAQTVSNSPKVTVLPSRTITIWLPDVWFKFMAWLLCCLKLFMFLIS